MNIEQGMSNVEVKKLLRFNIPCSAVQHSLLIQRPTLLNLPMGAICLQTNHYATNKLHRSGMLFLCFIYRSYGAKVLYITFFYKHFTPTGLFFSKNQIFLADKQIKETSRLEACATD